MALHKYCPHMSQAVCDIDPTMLEIAVSYFGYRPKVNHSKFDGCDGIEYIAKYKEDKDENGTKGMQLIFLDVNGVDSGSGLSAPPSAFVTNECLGNAYSLLEDGGVLAINVVARGDDVISGLEKKLCKVFLSAGNGGGAASAVDKGEEVDDVRAMIQAAMRGESELELDGAASLPSPPPSTDTASISTDATVGSTGAGAVYRLTAADDVVNRTLFCVKGTAAQGMQEHRNSVLFKDTADPLKLGELVSMLERVC